MVDIGFTARGGQQVDDHGRADAHGGKGDLPRPPLLDVDRLQPERADVERQRALHVGHVEHEMVEVLDAHRGLLLLAG
ncbi:MAG TPA: hypothetical protein VKV06_00250, partial [Acidimicrobiales bacterium]|nr:hypothetical protein [Acidimicrobiales bacterium]